MWLLAVVDTGVGKEHVGEVLSAAQVWRAATAARAAAAQTQGKLPVSLAPQRVPRRGTGAEPKPQSGEQSINVGVVVLRKSANHALVYLGTNLKLGGNFHLPQELLLPVWAEAAILWSDVNFRTVVSFKAMFKGSQDCYGQGNLENIT